MGGYSFLFKIIFKHKKKLFFTLILMAFSTFLGYSIPYLFKVILDNVNTMDYKSFLLIVPSIIIFGLTMYFSSIFSDKYFNIYTQNIVFDIRKKIIDKIFNSNLSIFQKISQTDFVRIILSDTEEIKNALNSSVFLLFDIIIRIIALAFFISQIDIKVFLALFIWCILFFLLTKNMSNGIKDSKIKERKFYGKMTSKFKDFIIGNIDIRYLMPFKALNDELDINFKDYLKSSNEAEVKMSKYRNLTTVSEFGIILILIVYALLQNKNGTFDISKTLTLFIYSPYILPIIHQVYHLQSNFTNIKGLINPLYEIFNIPTEEKAIDVDCIDNIKTENLSLTLGNNTLFEKLNLNFQKGNIYIIKGISGKGKSSFLNSILDLLPHDGEIYINNDKDIKDISLKSLNKRIMYIPQDVYIFNETIMYNINFNSDKKISTNLLTELNLDSIAKRLETSIGENNNEVISGGEKKRIGLARVLNFHDDKDIIVLDETFSNMDSETKLKTLNKVISFSKDKILIITTHDTEIFEYIKNMPNIIEIGI
jgi:ABC-type bacteriocin/lantibiotic exporter with double-glycine peptidase domain